MSKLLTFNPEERIKPFHALAHPYFDELKKSKILINNRVVVELFNLTPEEIGEDTKLVSKIVPK